jgi:hypothetical protein
MTWEDLAVAVDLGATVSCALVSPPRRGLHAPRAPLLRLAAPRHLSRSHLPATASRVDSAAVGSGASVEACVMGATPHRVLPVPRARLVALAPPRRRP